jgi:hypothetical protein
MSLFNQFFGLACETKILEACNWDENRAAILMDVLSDTLEKCIKEEKLSIEDVKDYLKSSHQDLIVESELDALVSVVQDSIDNFPFLVMKEPEYEN